MRAIRPQTRGAFTKVDLLICIAAVFGIALVIFPALRRPMMRSAKIACTNNLKQVGLAFRLWSTDSSDTFHMHRSTNDGGVKELAEQGSAYVIFLALSNELSTPKILICPEETNPQRHPANTFESVSFQGAPSGVVPFTLGNCISYFVGSGRVRK